MGVNQQDAVVVALYASALLDYLRLRGIEPAQLYSNTHLDTIKRIETHQQTTVSQWLSMFEIARDTLNEPDFAIKAGASITIRHIGVLGRVIMSCATLGEGIMQIRRYIRLVGEFSMPRMEIRDDRAHFILSWPYEEAPQPPEVAVQFLLAARITLSRWLTGRPDLAWEAHFYFPKPDDISTYQEVFRAPVFFDQEENRSVMPASDLDLPLVAADKNLKSKAEAEANAVLKQLSNETDLIQSLRRLLIDNLETGQSSLEQAAAQLNMNPRTLQRRLREEGVTFRHVFDEVRLTRARQYLADPKLQLAEIAFLLGYSEQSAFQYAFKQWTNLTPGEFRERTTSSN